MEGLIAGRWLPRGDGRAVSLRVRLTGALPWGVAVSATLPGPFVVPAVYCFMAAGGRAIVDLRVVEAGGAGESGGAGGVWGAAELMARGRRPASSFGWSDGGIALSEDVQTEWYPWFVYEGRAARLVLSVENPIPLGDPGVAVAVSVWPLVLAGVDGEYEEEEPRAAKPAVAVRRAYAGPHAAAFGR